VCPKCKEELRLETQEEHGDRIKEGSFFCDHCRHQYPIRGYIPRFLLESTNYSAGFGFQWNKHYNTQYDSHTGIGISAERFFKETRWPRHLWGEIILEAGCGSGRFTEHAVSTGATVVSLDYSNAVEATLKGNGAAENLLVLQASIYEMPFRENYFDKIFCLGVIQHTPDPRAAFRCLSDVLAPCGQLVLDVYKRLPWYKMVFFTKYWFRPLTKRIPSNVLYAMCERWVKLWWPLTGLVVRLTKRQYLSWFLLIADYRGVYPLPDALQREWSVLDTFDMLSPAYDHPQTIDSVRSWFESSGLRSVEVGDGYNGIEGRGEKPRRFQRDEKVEQHARTQPPRIV
jgi:SAM-dependent methyltransferase